MAKILRLSNESKMLTGVCGGIGHYFDLDPTIVRIIWALLTLLSAGLGGVLAYGICYLIMNNNK